MAAPSRGALVEQQERLIARVRDVGQLRKELNSVDEGTTKSLINYPIEKFLGRTLVHLAAGKGCWESLDLFLNSGGKILQLCCCLVIATAFISKVFSIKEPPCIELKLGPVRPLAVTPTSVATT